MTTPLVPPSARTERTDHELRRTLAHLNERAWGVALGLLLGFGLSIATLILVLKGGVHVGAHLGLLGIFLPGYRVTVLGAFLGLVYGCVIGYAFGRIVATVYNWVAMPRHE